MKTMNRYRGFKFWNTAMLLSATSFCITSQSQTIDSNYYWYNGLYDPEANFYQVRQCGWDYFNSHPELDTLKGSGIKNLLRWEQFWQDRVYRYGDTVAGSYNFAYDAMEEFLDHRDNYYQNPYNENLTWQFFGPENQPEQRMGFVSCIDVVNSDSNFNTIYAGTNSSGLFKTTDGGAHWFCVTDTIGLPGLGVQDVVVDQNNPSVIYICTGITTYGRGYGKGIYKSTNGGSTWQNIFSIQNSSMKVVHKLVLDPDDSSVLFAIINDEVYRSTDYGNNWSRIFNSLSQPPSGAKRNLLDIELKPGSNDTVYISSSGLAYKENGTQYYLTSEIWRCSNASAQDNIAWSRIDDDSWPFNDRIELAVTEAAPEELFTCFSFNIEGPDTFALYKSSDFGGNWTEYLKQQTSHNGYGAYFGGVNEHRMELVVSPSDEDVIYVGGYYVGKITNSGQTISSNDCSEFTCNGFHVDVRELIMAVGSQQGMGGIADVLFAGNDGGISKTANGAQSWSNINGDGLTITQFYGLANALNIEELVTAGCQDNGWYTYQPSQGSWLNSVSGDGYECHIDYFDPVITYNSGFTTRPYIKYTKSSGMGSITLPNELVRPDWPFIMAPVNPDLLFTGMHDVHKIFKSGNGYEIEKISNFSNSHHVDDNATLSSLAIWVKDLDVIYAAYGEPTWKDTACQINKLFKTSDGGNQWIDLTCGLEFIRWLGITNILVHPDDHDKVWLTLGGFANNPGSLRVIYTEDSFGTYVDMSEGLPDLPVNCIKMATTDDHQLFIANDAGVFYRDDTMEQWQIYVQGTPVTIFSDIEINRKYNRIYASTFGRGIWYTEGTLPCPEVSYPDTILISSDTTWETEVRMHHNLLVGPNARLTIKGTVYMGSGNRIMVDKGGILTLDGSLITNSCDGDYWQGIEVWGDIDKSQMQSSHFGIVELKNGATLENALVGIATIRKFDGFHTPDWAGGIIYADSSFFINNRIHIQFHKYANFYPWDSIYKNEIANLSYFSNCQFVTGGKNDSIQSFSVKLDNVTGIEFNQCRFQFLKEIDTALSDMYKSFVFLQNSSEIDFKGCLFSNDAPYADHEYFIQKRGIGLYSYNTSFFVRPSDTTSLDERSTFSKLTYGIKALSISSDKQFTTDSCLFYQTARGIYNSGTRYQTITSNTFYLPSSGASVEFQPYGVYLDNCSQYHVENNMFSPVKDGIANNVIGLIINNSGEELNMIYRNYFRRLHYGILAQNDNRGDDEDWQTGLKLKCNEFDTVKYDIFVTREGNEYPPSGISKYQGYFGSEDAPAGNQFSHWPAPPEENQNTDYYNMLDHIIYFHHDTTQSPLGLNLVPWYYSNWSITKQMTGYGYVDSLSCLPKLDERIRESLRSSISVAEAEMDTNIMLLEAWVDGGNTLALQEEIDYSTPPEGYDLRNELLSESPYLSDTVLINAIEKEDVLTDVLIRDVLVANPQAPKSLKIMDELNGRAFALPDYMLEEIQQGIFTVSQRETLEAKLAYHYQERTLARNALIRSFIQDTAISAFDSLVNFYSVENDKHLKYDLAFLFLSKYDSNQAINTLNTIPQLYNLSSAEQALNQNYLDYFEIMTGFYDNDTTELIIDSTQRTGLYSLVNNGYSPVKTYARNILQVLDTLRYNEPIILTDDYSKSIKVPSGTFSNEEKASAYIRVYPNPAGNFFIFSYKAETAVSSLAFRLTDSRGILLKEFPLHSAENKFVFGTENLESGVYFCNLVENNSVKETVKIIIYH